MINIYNYEPYDHIYYIFITFNKTKLDNDDINILIKLGYCANCLIKIKNKILSDEEISYIFSKNWDDFCNKYCFRLIQCNCTRCNCGCNKNLEVIYDLFDYKEKFPNYHLTCQKCCLKNISSHLLSKENFNNLMDEYKKELLK